MGTYYMITVEYMPDCSGDPDMFRMHRETEYVIPLSGEDKEKTFNEVKRIEEQIRKLDPSKS